MKFGLTGTARARHFRGHTAPYHIVRERDIDEIDCRMRLFARGLCGASIIGFYLGLCQPSTLCKRCEKMSGVSKRRLRT